MTTNVRFYRLETLPSFDATKHTGIFVHVTGIMSKEKNGALVMNTDKLILSQWLEKRLINEIESGLWFGGENGWELLSNETNSGAINDAIDAKINTLNADGFTQATIGANPEGSESATGSTLTIKGIKEEQGIIKQDETKNFEVAIDGTYNNSTNKIATQSTVTNAIGALDVDTIQAVTFNTSNVDGNTTLTFKGIKEVDGRIAQGDEQTPDTFIVGDAKLNIEIGSDSFEVFSANTKENKSIYLNKNVFKKDVVDGKNVLSIYTTEGVSSTNPLVTQQDIANLGGAMHYKGPLTGAQTGAGSWPQTVAAGDVYIVTTGFTHSNESNPFEVGDMIVFNSTSASDYKVIQSNLTLGTGDGQVAANVGALADGKLVVATNNGIRTTDISATVLETSNNNRDLSYGNVTGGISIKDSLTVLGINLEKTINITSNNRSIEIAKNPSDTGVMVDLVWNTTIE